MADRVLQNFKSGKIGKYEVILRPHNSKDSSTVFVGGLRGNLTQAELEQAFKHYSPIISCSVQPLGNNQITKNGSITFGNT